MQKKKELEEAKLNEKKITGKLFVYVKEAADLLATDFGGTSDPFVKIKLNKGANKIVETSIIKSKLNP